MNSFEHSITYMQNELKRYAKSDNAKASAVRAKEQIINQLVEAWNAREAYIDKLEEEAIAGAYKHSAQKQHISMLEAILLIHGVTDFATWFAKGAGYLRCMAIEFIKTGIIQTPERISCSKQLNYGFVKKSKVHTTTL